MIWRFALCVVPTSVLLQGDCMILRDTQFLEYQLTPEDELPLTESGIDTFWGLMADHKEPFTDKLSFRVLSKLAKACCVIPVSNADPERIFSMLKKIQTDMRSDLNNDTICCLICAKQNQDKACFEFNPSDSVLRAAKKAVLTYQSNISSCN